MGTSYRVPTGFFVGTLIWHDRTRRGSTDRSTVPYRCTIDVRTHTGPYGVPTGPPGAPSGPDGPPADRRRHRRTPLNRRLPGLGGPPLLSAQAGALPCLTILHLSCLSRRHLSCLTSRHLAAQGSSWQAPACADRSGGPPKPCTGAALGKRYIEVYPVAAAAVGRSWLGGVNPPQRRRPIWEGVTPGGGGRPTQIAIFAFSATRQTAMPIRIVPRFCARGCGRSEKLLCGC